MKYNWNDWKEKLTGKIIVVDNNITKKENE
jgi:hypothetical protein